MKRTGWNIVAIGCLGWLGCTSSPPSSGASLSSGASASAPAPSSLPPSSAAAPQPAPSLIPGSATAAASSAEPVASASASPSASAAAQPVPDVEVKNIGMHIGGGPNDTVTKAPIKRSVEPHFDAFKICFGKADEQKQGDVSVDLKIQAAGGKAALTKYKSAIKGEAFESCVKDTFAQIDFEKPKGGATVVSYSLRFTPPKHKKSHDGG